MTDGLSNELEYCQQTIKPLLAALQRVTSALPTAAANGDAAALRTLLSSARLACRVFFSLNSPGLTEVHSASFTLCSHKAGGKGWRRIRLAQSRA